MLLDAMLDGRGVTAPRRKIPSKGSLVLPQQVGVLAYVRSPAVRGVPANGEVGVVLQKC
eukprot:m.545232 g.545232  ORF g.545232 m.545232 type:complete len:59 (+) comp22143_c0_seq5:891-1067(+)